MQPLIFIIHILAIAALIALTLTQHGKGADVGASFGAGASQTMFGSQGSTPFLIKVTALVAAVFFATSLLLGHFMAKQAKVARAELAPISAPSISMPLTSED